MSAPFFEILKKLKEKCDLFQDFSDQELKDLLQLAEIEKIDIPSKTIFYQDDRAEYLYLILSGKVEVFYSDLKQTVISTLEAGDIFGEMSLITNTKRSANVRVFEEPLLLFKISDKVLEGDHKIQAKIYKNFARILSNRLKVKNLEAGNIAE